MFVETMLHSYILGFTINYLMCWMYCRKGGEIICKCYVFCMNGTRARCACEVRQHNLCQKKIRTRWTFFQIIFLGGLLVVVSLIPNISQHKQNIRILSPNFVYFNVNYISIITYVCLFVWIIYT